MTTTLFDKPDTTEAPMSTGALVEHHHEPPTPMLIIQRLVESGQDPTAMFNLAERWEANIAADNYGIALAKFQGKCPMITKRRQIDLGSGKGPMYASLDDIMREIAPLLAECGLSVTFSAGLTDSGQLRAVCTVRHGRHSEPSEVTMPVPTQMRVNDTQKMGAALSYAKRYALCAALNIIVTDEDMDAANVMETITEEQIATLREWIATTNSNEKAFLKYLGVGSFAEIHAADFHKALTALQQKAKK